MKRTSSTLLWQEFLRPLNLQEFLSLLELEQEIAILLNKNQENFAGIEPKNVLLVAKGAKWLKTSSEGLIFLEIPNKERLFSPGRRRRLSPLTKDPPKEGN